MRMNRKAALMVGASFGAAFLAACSDSPVAPAAKAPATPSLAVGDVASPTPVPGKLIVCKAGNIGGDFTVTRVAGSGAFDDNGLHLEPGQCVVVAEDNSPQGFGSVFRAHEVSAANVTYVLSGQAIEIGFPPTALVGPTDNQDFFINSIHGIRVTYTNTFTPPPSGCTYTKGWYRNNGRETVTAVDGRTKSEAQQIFDATPGQPGNVTWGNNNKPNDLLNLYQQLLAAILNGGLNGPQSVKTAIANAQAATGGTGLNITVVPGADIGALTAPLSDFNEGNVANFPHCN